MTIIDPEHGNHAYQRALDGTDWLVDLAGELRRRLREQRDQDGRIDDATAVAASVNVARACSLIAWHHVCTTADELRGRCGLPQERKDITRWSNNYPGIAAEPCEPSSTN